MTPTQLNKSCVWEILYCMGSVANPSYDEYTKSNLKYTKFISITKTYNITLFFQSYNAFLFTLLLHVND